MGWKDDVKMVIQNKWSVGQMFTLDDVYQFRGQFAKSHPNNGHVTDKIRQTLQYLRDDGIIEFVDNNGYYKRLV